MSFRLGRSLDHAKDLAYGVAGELTSMKYLQWEDSSSQYYLTETRDYNELFQFATQKTQGAVTPAEIAYGHSAGANNGRILSRTNFQRGVIDGEVVTYAYDDLNRLKTATGTTKQMVGGTPTVVNTWGQDFVYDGFGNMTDQTPKIGYPVGSPNVTLALDQARTG